MYSAPILSGLSGSSSFVERIRSPSGMLLSVKVEDSMNVETSSPEQKPLAGVSDDVAALRRRAAAARASLGSARSVPDSAGKDRIAALRTRLAVAARTPAAVSE